MNPEKVAETLIRQLRQVGTKDRAAGAKAYLKSELEHLGLRVSEVRAAVKELQLEYPDLDRRELVKLVRALWKRPIFESRLAAVELLWMGRDQLGAPDLSLVEKLLRESNTWALVDPLAVNTAGELVERFPQQVKVLDRWAKDEDFWIRRSAMLALLKPLRRGDGDFERFAGYADTMLEEKEFFIRKAIGWVLRETAKKRPRLVYDWLKPRAGRASGVTMREAVKPLSTRQAKTLMAAYRAP